MFRTITSPTATYSYEHTLLHGKYSHVQAPHADSLSEEECLLEPDAQSKFPEEKLPVCMSRYQKILSVFGEDWVFLAALGVLMAIFSYLMDFCIEKLQHAHFWLYEVAADVHWSLQFFLWTGYTVLLVSATTVFVHWVAPQAVGSGIPEMKTILRGVVLKEYLTWRALLSKMVGLTVSLGSGLPIGKEGPFVHVASIAATLLSRLVVTFKGIYENESRNSEMLAAACAVGVACTFGAPVGGVLFSIEVTSVYFAVRNYWRGFFAAACSATVFRLLAVWFRKEVTVKAFYRTAFPGDTAFYPEELIIFSFIGLACGFGGALFIYTHRSIILFVRKAPLLKSLIQRNILFYSAAVALLVASLTFPSGFGKFIGGGLSFRDAIDDLFSNFSWLDADLTGSEAAVVARWAPPSSNIFVTLLLFTLTNFFLAALANTLPIPAGVFIPVFVIGAAFGRLTGESMAAWFPRGLHGRASKIIPGGYAVVGAAAFVGSVTHTVSVSVIVFELTGQLVYILPVMIAVLIANAVCSRLQPSIYDSMIKIKHLPYLPDMPATSFHRVHADQLMVRQVRFISRETTFGQLQDLLIQMPRLKSFPLVDSARSMLLLGSVPRVHLEECLNAKVGETARRHEVRRRRLAATQAEGASAVQQPDNRFLYPQSAQSRFLVTSVDETDTADPNEEAASPLSAAATLSADFDQPPSSRNASPVNTVNTIGGLFSMRSRQLWSHMRHPRHRHASHEIDMTSDERRSWEDGQLALALDLARLRVDAAPFQLVERCSLYKIHSLFSLLGLNRAYVTNCGRLIGVVALRELRGALEQAHSGLLQPDQTPESTTRSSSPNDEQSMPPFEEAGSDASDNRLLDTL